MSDEFENKSVEEVADATETTENVENVAIAEVATEEATATPAVAETVTEAVPAVTENKVVKEKAPKAKSTTKWAILAVAAVALILIIANAPRIGNAAVKLFASPAGYFQHVEGKVMDDMIEQFADAYDDAITSMFAAEDASSKAEIGVQFGEDILDMMEDETDIDFKWMEKISFNVASDSTKDASKASVGFSLNDKQLISLLVMMNMKDGVGYAQVPELNESYLGMDLEEFFEMCELDMDMDDINEIYETYDKIYKAMPDKSKLEKVLKRYSNLALSCIDDVTEDKEEVTVGEYTDKYTVLEATIDEKTLQAMLEVIVKELKEDKDVKEIMEEVLSVQDEVDFDDVYDEFLDALDDFEDELDDLDDEDFEIIWKTYVNGKGEICGRVFEIEEADAEVSSLMVKKGNKYAYELEVNVEGVKVVLEGTGKMTSSKLDGDFKLKAVGMKMAEIKLEDVKVKDLEDGYFNGTISVSLASVAAKAVEDEIGDDFPFDIEDLVLEIKADTGKKKSDVKVSLLEKDKLIIGFNVASETGKAGKIKFPKDKEVVMVEDEDDLLDWVGDIDFDEFLESLESKVDDSLVDLIDDIMDGDVSLPSFDDYDDDYWYDYDYWY